jgi:hypothetical protein
MRGRLWCQQHRTVQSQEEEDGASAAISRLHTGWDEAGPHFTKDGPEHLNNSKTEQEAEFSNHSRFTGQDLILYICISPLGRGL